MKIPFKYTGPTEFFADSWLDAEQKILGHLEEDEDVEYSDEDLKEAARNAEADRKFDDLKEKEVA
jgi:hypothetical protein